MPKAKAKAKTAKPKTKVVTYRGPGSRDPFAAMVPHVYETENRGKTYRFRTGEPQAVPDEVAQGLSKAEGHMFDIKEG